MVFFCREGEDVQGPFSFAVDETPSFALFWIQISSTRISQQGPPISHKQLKKFNQLNHLLAFYQISSGSSDPLD
jgi:hypothetical protein